MRRISLFFSTLFYVGNIRIAPGTFSSLLTVLFWTYLIPNDLFIRFLYFLIFFVLSIIVTHYSLELFHDDDDPQNIVIDEFIGMSIPLLYIADNILLICISFLVFRFLDIVKPSIVYYAQSYRGAVGVLMDDILSGIITLLILMYYL
tara:strand:+ start:161 stop:601 length:441 start_codon:yes stop_codon:yes gene_type:complete